MRRSRRAHLVPLVLSLGLLGSSAPGSPASPEPAEPLVLADALARVVERSPALAAEAWSVRAAEAKGLYAAARKNPEVTLQVEDAVGTGKLEGFSAAQTTLQLGQLLELGGKRAERRSLAQSEENMARVELEAAKIDVLGDATVAFVHVVGDQHRVTLAEKARTFAEDAVAAASRRVSSGAASVVEVERAKVRAARATIVEEHVRHEMLSSRRRLAAMWGSTDPRFTEAKADLFARSSPAPFDELAARIERSPDLRRIAAERTRRAAALDLARAKGVPDVQVFLGARRLEGPGETAFLGGVTVPLPFNRNRGEIGEADALRSQIADRESAMRVELLAALFETYQELMHVITELEALESEVLPGAESVRAAVDEGFKAGRFSQIELVDAQTTLLDVEKERIDAAERYHTYVVRLEQLLGESLFK